MRMTEVMRGIKKHGIKRITKITINGKRRIKIVPLEDLIPYYQKKVIPESRKKLRKLILKHIAVEKIKINKMCDNLLNSALFNLAIHAIKRKEKFFKVTNSKNSVQIITMMNKLIVQLDKHRYVLSGNKCVDKNGNTTQLKRGL